MSQTLDERRAKAIKDTSKAKEDTTAKPFKPIIEARKKTKASKMLNSKVGKSELKIETTSRKGKSSKAVVGIDSSLNSPTLTPFHSPVATLKPSGFPSAAPYFSLQSPMPSNAPSSVLDQSEPPSAQESDKWPTNAPTLARKEKTPLPTAKPSAKRSMKPTNAPRESDPTQAPVNLPTPGPTSDPSQASPSATPNLAPSLAPVTYAPTTRPSTRDSSFPSHTPTSSLTMRPTIVSIDIPSASTIPSITPTLLITDIPTYPPLTAIVASDVALKVRLVSKSSKNGRQMKRNGGEAIASDKAISFAKSGKITKKDQSIVKNESNFNVEKTGNIAKPTLLERNKEQGRSNKYETNEDFMIYPESLVTKYVNRAKASKKEKRL